MNKTINVIDLFCGCGGLSLGFENAGYNILLGIDNNKPALDTFEKNHIGGKTICGDITKIHGFDILSKVDGKPIDVVIGGPPCQGMSLSGFRKFDDPRNRLYLSFIRIVKELQPKAFMIENVPGLVSLFDGKIKDNIIKRFEELGYCVAYKILCAADYGVPQNRRRVIFVGIKGDTKFEFPKPQNKIVTTKMALSDLPPLTDNLGSEQMEYVSPAQNDYQKAMRQGSLGVYNHIAANHSDKVKKIISLVPDGGNYKDLPEEYKNSRNFHVAWTRFPSDKPAPTIDTGHRHHFHYEYNRVPTVRECARIQSFPDRFIFSGTKTEQFKQVGNAVPPLLAEAIAEKLKQYL